MFTDNDTFYPITDELVKLMQEKIIGYPVRVLDPSAGRGDLLDKLQESSYVGGYGKQKIEKAGLYVIEKDPDLQAVLRGRGYKILDSDFLTYAGPDKFDLIIMNPPFNRGAEHLLKAIDVMYNGQILCLLNENTLELSDLNKTRRHLRKKLSELGAKYTYLGTPFKDAERRTEVKVVLVNISIENKVENDLFEGVTDANGIKVDPAEESKELITGKKVETLVAEYNELVRISTQTILDYFRNYPKIGKYIGLNREPKSYLIKADSLTKLVEGTLNETVAEIRTDFWRKTLDLPEVVSRMTKKRAEEFHQMVNDQCHMDFTENNIRAFVLNLIGGYKNSLRDAVVALFDKMTIKHCYNGGPNEKNIHYYDGWKTNKAFKVNHRIVMPFYASYEGAFRDYGKWKISYSVVPDLRDIDVVMNYFDGMAPYYQSIVEALTAAFSKDENSTSSSYFSKITAHKKGTVHFTFRDEDILRRFNIEAGKGKGWLPENYGVTPFKELTMEEQKVAESFEGRESYTKNIGRCGIDAPKLKAIEDKPVVEQMEMFA